jgi:hypothetical protein
MSKVQQMISQDERTAGDIQELWLAEVCKTFAQPERLPAEVTTDQTERDTHLTTVWSKGRVVALAIRQRDMANYTVLTLVEIEK